MKLLALLALFASITVAAAETVIMPGADRPAQCRSTDPRQPCVYVPGPYDGPAVGPYWRGPGPGAHFRPPPEPSPPPPTHPPAQITPKGGWGKGPEGEIIRP